MSDSFKLFMVAALVVGVWWFARKLEAPLYRSALKLHGTWLGLCIGILGLGSAFGGVCWYLYRSLVSGSIHCFGRRCDSTYVLASSPDAYWVTVAIWGAVATFFLWLMIYAVAKFARARLEP